MKRLGALRQAVMTRAMTLASARRKLVEVSGLSIVVAPGVCNPAPALGLSFAPLFEAALDGLGAGQTVLDMGTGAGVWALLAVRAGATVTATDLPHVPTAPLHESARLNDLPPPRLVSGELFEAVAGERFDRVLFNPPFHFGEPKGDAERAYLGGADGEVLKRFLASLDEHLEPDGVAYVILPRAEREGYADALASLDVEVRAAQWMPVLGRAELLAISPRRSET